MLRRLLVLHALAALLIPAGALTARAQEPQTETAAPAYVAFVEGDATLDRDGRAERAPLNMPLLSGDRIATSNGRVEIRFGDDSTLYVDARTTIDFQSDELLRLIDGRVRVNIPRAVQDVSYRVDSPAGSARIVQPGEYRVEILHGERETQLEFAVVRGGGEVFTDQGSTPVRAGERAYASAGLAPSYAYAYNSAAWDDFDRWAESRRTVQYGASAQYLPEEVRSYAPVLDEYGDWRYSQPYGYVWYPRVATTWRPYYYGRWVSYPRYGWTWVGLDGFGWPTHHYGRWGFSAGAWFWIPGRHWSPAWVSWAYAPGYVSWCPLGFNNRPIYALDVNVGFGGRSYSPWNYWTVVAAPHFGYGYVHQRVIHVDRVFDQRSRPVFVSRPTAPEFRSVAVPRNSVPIRWAGSRASLAQNDGRGVRPNGPAPRDTYFSRESVQREHAVERAPGAPLPPPSPSRDAGSPARTTFGTRAPARDVPVRRDVSPGVSAPRSGNPPASESRPGGVMQRTAPDGAARPVQPRGSAVPRESVRGSAIDPRPSMSPQPGASRVERPAPSRVEGPAPSRVERPEYSRPGMVMPRETAPRSQPAPSRVERAAPQGIPGRGYEPRAEPRHEAPAPSRVEGPAPSRVERPAPSRGESPGPSRGERSAPSRGEAAPSQAAPRDGSRPMAVPRRGKG